MQALEILHVEDDVADRGIAQRALKHIRASVTAAGSITEAETLIEQRRFDCMILDWRLPDGTADTFLPRVRQALPQLPIVVLTGARDEALARRFLQWGAQDFLLKDNLGTNDLARSVQYAVERHRATELASQLEHAQRLASIGVLSAGVAHELNNPAQALVANLTSVREQLDRHGEIAPDELAEIVDQCTLAVDRIVSLTQQVGRFSRRGPSDAEPTDLAALIREALSLARPSARHRAQLMLHLETVPSIVVLRQAIAGVFINLLVNAQQAIDSVDVDRAHRIRISLTSIDHAVVVTVEDSGPGVAEADAAKLFEPFETGSADGTGLGLAIAQEVVVAHRGRIEVGASSLGGAAFKVTIPLDTGLIAAPRPAEVVQLPTLDILIIDDEQQVRKGVARVLKDHRTVQAESADEAFALLATGYRPDVILCDLLMPKRTGIDFLQALSSDYADLQHRVIIASGGAPTPQTQQFLDRTLAKVLLKPFTVAELMAVIADVHAARAGGIASPQSGEIMGA